MKKKLICTAIILTMITSLTACDSNSTSDAATDDDNMAVSTEMRISYCILCVKPLPLLQV